MANELQIFNNPEFGEIRTLEIDGESWFVGKDIAAALGYSNSRDALATHIDDEDKATVAIHDGSQNRNMTIINESGVYALIFSSKLPSAKKFKHWVTSEVLPAIRKTGTYTAPEMSEELKAIIMIDQRTVQHEKRITALEDNMVIDYGQQRALTSRVNEVVVEALGGTSAPAYTDKTIRSRTYSECNRDIQRWFNVNSRNNIPRKRFEEAVEYIHGWKPSTNMSMSIRQANEQTIF